MEYLIYFLAIIYEIAEHLEPASYDCIISWLTVLHIVDREKLFKMVYDSIYVYHIISIRPSTTTTYTHLLILVIVVSPFAATGGILLCRRFLPEAHLNTNRKKDFAR